MASHIWPVYDNNDLRDDDMLITCAYYLYYDICKYLGIYPTVLMLYGYLRYMQGIHHQDGRQWRAVRHIKPDLILCGMHNVDIGE